MRRIGEVVLLTAIAVFGAVLRFSGLAVPSLWLDEILDYDVATKLTHELVHCGYQLLRPVNGFVIRCQLVAALRRNQPQ